MNNFILLAFFAIIMVIYFIFYHEKSLNFVLIILWFVLNILIIIFNINFDNNILKMPKIEVYNYVNEFSKLITNLKSLRFLVFCGIIISFYFRKKRSNKKPSDDSIYEINN